jgi:hypothetical protein
MNEIEQRAAAATAGPWDIDNDGQLRSGIKLVAGPDPVIRDGDLWSDGIRYPNNKDAEFIAHARTDIPFLLSEVHRLTEENEKYRATFDKAQRAGYKEGSLLPDLVEQMDINMRLTAELRTQTERADKAEKRAEAKMVYHKKVCGGYKYVDCPTCKSSIEISRSCELEMPYCGSCGKIVLDAAQKYCCWCGKAFNENKGEAKEE